jgi:hypothetical protein
LNKLTYFYESWKCRSYLKKLNQNSNITISSSPPITGIQEASFSERQGSFCATCFSGLNLISAPFCARCVTRRPSSHTLVCVRLIRPRLLGAAHGPRSRRARPLAAGGGAKGVGIAVNETLVLCVVALFAVNVIFTTIGVRFGTGT